METTERRRPDDSWHLKKELNASHILTTATILGGLLLWGSQVETRLEMVENDHNGLVTSITKMSDKVGEIAEDIAYLRGKAEQKEGMIKMDADQLKELIIESSLDDLGLKSDPAVQLLMLTAAQESKLGHYIAQIKGPALGIFQMEPLTHDDIWENYLKYKPDLASKLQHIAGTYPINPPAALLVHNLKYAAAMARIHYRRVKEALPRYNDITGMAHYWKRHYNTELGRGKPEEAVKNYFKYVEA